MDQLNTMTVPQLIELQEAVGKMIKTKQKDARSELLAQFSELSKNSGLTLEEVIGKTVKKKTPPPIKYRNPDDKNQTWTGRGKKPKWIQTALDQGKKIEDFDVSAVPA